MSWLPIEPKDPCRLDGISLGEIMLRLDPGDGRPPGRLDYFRVAAIRPKAGVAVPPADPPISTVTESFAVEDVELKSTVYTLYSGALVSWVNSRSRPMLPRRKWR